MKTILLVLGVLFCLVAKSQMYQNTVMMQVTQQQQTVDEKYRVVQQAFKGVKQQVKHLSTQEAVGNTIKNKVAIKKLMDDIDLLITTAKPTFVKSTSYTMQVDSLQTVMEKSRLTSEITRLTALVTAGEDSAQVNPMIRQYAERKKTLTSYTNTWTRVK